MTLFEDSRYDWRETYFVYFESAHWPKFSDIRRMLRTCAPLLSILNRKTEPDGSLTAMTIASYEDHAALEIVYREGKDVLAEAQQLVRTLKKEASEAETKKLHKIAQCTMRFDIHHFEQTADTHVFNITKVPELNFSKQSTISVDAFSKALKMGATSKGKFYFDPNSYEECRSDHAGEELDNDNGMDSTIIERINPEMLVAVLEVFCRISRGIAIDPSSGIVLA